MAVTNAALQRSLRITAGYAAQHATGPEALQLTRLLDAHANGAVSTRDTRDAIIELRRTQHRRAVAQRDTTGPA